MQNVYFPHAAERERRRSSSRRSPAAKASTRSSSRAGSRIRSGCSTSTRRRAKPISPSLGRPRHEGRGALHRRERLRHAARRPALQRRARGRLPAGLALSPDGETLYVANNLGDSLGIVHPAQSEGARTHRPRRPAVAAGRRAAPDARARRRSGYHVYPYDVAALARKVYVSCWNDESVAVVELAGGGAARLVRAGREAPDGLEVEPDGLAPLRRQLERRQRLGHRHRRRPRGRAHRRPPRRRRARSAQAPRGSRSPTTAARSTSPTRTATPSPSSPSPTPRAG